MEDRGLKLVVVGDERIGMGPDVSFGGDDDDDDDGLMRTISLPSRKAVLTTTGPVGAS